MVQYLPGKENGMAEALSREERHKMVPLDKTPDTSLAAGNVAHMKSLCGKPGKSEYPGKKPELYKYIISLVN